MNLSIEQDTTTVVYGIIGAILISLAEIEFLVWMSRLGQKTLEKLVNRFSDSEDDQ